MEFIRTKLLVMLLVLMPTTPTTSLPIPNDFGIIFHKEDRDVEEEALPQPTRFTRDEDIRLLAMACTAEAETESEFLKRARHSNGY